MKLWLISSPSQSHSSSPVPEDPYILYISRFINTADSVAIFCSVLFKQRSLTWSNSSDSRVAALGVSDVSGWEWCLVKPLICELMRGCGEAGAEARPEQNTERRLHQNSNKRLITRAVANGNDVNVSSVAWIGNALLTFGNGMDFTPTPTRLPRLSPVTDRGPRRTTVFVTMETEQNALSPAKPTQVRVRDEEQFVYGFTTALIIVWLRRNQLYTIKSYFICAAERLQNWADFSRAVQNGKWGVLINLKWNKNVLLVSVWSAALCSFSVVGN